jgi:transcriptional regulator with XRE-family HTH domain
MTPVKRVAMNIKRLREARGFSQQGLADKAKLSREYISRIEAARQDPTVVTLQKIAKALKVKLADLVK